MSGKLGSKVGWARQDSSAFFEICTVDGVKAEATY
jgi:hypothetical protein